MDLAEILRMFRLDCDVVYTAHGTIKIVGPGDNNTYTFDSSKKNLAICEKYLTYRQGFLDMLEAV